MPEQTQIPRVLWAQQREHVLLTITVPDIEKVDVKFEEDSVSFQGQSSSDAKDKNVYAVKINLYEKIDVDASKYENVGQKFWRLLLKKKDPKAPFWPRLTKEKQRLHWLQTDFDHWKDEDESDEEKAGPGGGGNFQDMFSGGMGGMPGMGGMGGMPGMGGMGGMGMGGMPGMGMGMGDDSDEEEGDLDDEEGSPKAAESGAHAHDKQDSKKSSDEPVTTATTTAAAAASEQEPVPKEQSA
jgi:hypothetical protein